MTKAATCMLTPALSRSVTDTQPTTLRTSSTRWLAPLRCAVPAPSAPRQPSASRGPRPALLAATAQPEAQLSSRRPAPMAATEAGDVVTPEAAWRRTEHLSDKEWTTYQGCWTMYSGAGTSGDDVLREYHGIRCFRLAGEGGRQLLHKNLISINLGFGSPVQRPDGFWESNYTYSVDEPTYSTSTEPQPSEAGQQPHQTRRLTVATSQAYLSSPAALPPADVAAAGADAAAGSKDVSGAGRSMLPPGVWACEAFLEDGMYRWSLGAVYELPSRKLKTTFLIREYDIPVDPASSLDPQRLPIPDARPGLGDPAGAADVKAGRACSVAEVRYGADGQLRRLPNGSAAEDGPGDDGTRLLQYPDGMWARIPEQLPAAGSSGSGDATFTWGGPMRYGCTVSTVDRTTITSGALAYQQLQATYAADTGTLASLRAMAWQ